MVEEPRGSISISSLQQLDALLDQLPVRGSQGKLVFAKVQAEIEQALRSIQEASRKPAESA